jgi:ABC-2 type transport system permease protein
MTAAPAPARTAANGGNDALVAIAGVTVRSLLARRRAVLLLVLAGLPVLLGLLARLRGLAGDGAEQTAGALGLIIGTTLLPLIALVFGTAAIGAELEDGSAIHLLTKPVARWRIVAAKAVAAVPVTAALAVGSTVLTGLLVGLGRGGEPVTLAYAVGVAIGSLVYVLAFLALSVLTSRALILGLAYVAIWEGALAGLFEATRILSIRQYVNGIVAALDPTGAVADRAALPVASAVLGAAIVAVGAFVLATRALATHQVRGGD